MENAKVKFGAVGWGDVVLPEARKNNVDFSDLFARLQPGNNVFRVVTKPHEYLSHKYKVDEKDPGYGVKVKSSLPHGRDPLMEQGHKPPTKRWYLGVIERASGSYKVLDITPSVMRQIRELVNDDDWGDPSQYDLNIKMDPKAPPTSFYTVIPKSKKPLTAEELKLKQEADLDQLKNLCAPPTPEQMEQRLKAIRERRDQTLGLAPGTSDPSPPAATVDSSSSDDDDDDEFPSVDGSD